MSARKYVYFFGEGSKKDKALLGGKGANLSEMVRMGLPIPGGFTLSSEACNAYVAAKAWPAGLAQQVDASLRRLEQATGQKLGDRRNPLLVSVRSGAAISMPGMMDTVLNLGLNDEIVEVVARLFNNPRFAYDSYRRFISMFGDVVMSVDRQLFEGELHAAKQRKGVKNDTELDAHDLKRLCATFKRVYAKATGQPFPSDPKQQLTMAISAVFDSWDNPRAIKYRQLNEIPDDMGTAVNVQAMVYGNMNNNSATGVGFTRNPSTGENRRFGEYLTNAQGEDVVAGVRTPKSLDEMATEFPAIHKQLMDIMELLENHYHDMQDIEYTVQDGKLFILQTRTGKRTAAAALKMAVDMVREGFISTETAVMRVEPKHLTALLHKTIDPRAKRNATLLTKGLPASPGAAVGQVVFTAEKAVEWKEQGKSVVLVRQETSPEDISGMAVSAGILTQRGGMTSHAAVVARGMNVCCVAGCSEIQVNEAAHTIEVAGRVLREGDAISLDGATGEVFAGALDVVTPDLHGDFEEFLSFCDQVRTIGVQANADTPHDAKIARGFGANGIGLCRTEHMFFAAERITSVREMILAKDGRGRQRALDKLLPFQRQDFHGILGAMSGLPVIIRLIDPPLHEFLPHDDAEMRDLAAQLPGFSFGDVKAKVEELHEFNPMLGFRGCRLGVVYPEINAMQIRAIFEAAIQLKQEGKDPRPHIEVPLVGNLKEFLPLKQLIRQIAKETGAEGRIHYEIGTMIEVPRAALTADDIAKEVDFISFGTNDLTQMTCGFSRDDAGSFLGEYVKQGIYSRDPFASIDQAGVGKLMRICILLARSVNPSIDIGICGEHAGEPHSVAFCHRIGLNNVSCSPYRIPIARLAAARAAVQYGKPRAQPRDLGLLARL